MKKQKIKNKYLSQIKNQKTPSETTNIFKKIEQKIWKFSLFLLLIILLLCWGLVPTIILQLLKIEPSTLSNTTKIIISTINDIALILIFIAIYFKELLQNFQNFFTKNFSQNLKTALKYWGIGLIIMIISNAIIAIITNGQLATNEESVRELIDLYPLYMVFQLIIYAPLTEELIFRKSIRDITSNKYLYPLLSGLIFGGLHVISSLKSITSLLYLIPYCSLGIAFALLYQKTDNIFSTITIHALHNSLALILYLTAV